MKREDITFAVSILLLISIIITGLSGYIQSEWELRKFVPHRYLAYTTLFLTAVHVALHAGKLWRYLKRRVFSKRS